MSNKLWRCLDYHITINTCVLYYYTKSYGWADDNLGGNNVEYALTINNFLLLLSKGKL